MVLQLTAITPKKFNVINEGKLRASLAYNMDSYLQYVKAQMQANYNTTIKPKRYRRTYRLQQGWEIHIADGGALGILQNNVPYAGRVQGPRGRLEAVDTDQQTQDPFMRSRKWKSITDVARESKKHFATLMNRSIISSIE